jgi:DNA replication protein
MEDVVFKTLKAKDFVIKNYIIKIAKELNLSLNEFILLIYFYNQEEPVLDIETISSTTSLTESEIMESFARLNGIKLIDIIIMKDEKGVRKEVISLDNITKQAASEITKNIKIREEKDIYAQFESEFGRPLRRTEYEIINDWLNTNIPTDLILEALKLAVYNGALSLRYINTILLDWKKKGYKNKTDLSVGLKSASENNILSDLFDSDWFDESE